MAMRYIKIDYNGYIYPIRMNGPIVTPLLMDEKVAMDAVISGYRCTEVDVKNNKEVKLTIDNFYKDDRFGVPLVKVPNIPKINTKNAEVTAKSIPDTISTTDTPNTEKEENSETKETAISIDIDTNNSEENKTYNFNKKDKKNKNK